MAKKKPTMRLGHTYFGWVWQCNGKSLNRNLTVGIFGHKPGFSPVGYSFHQGRWVRVRLVKV